ncbi:unnamed protein product [Peniophora sp. CBMAI 1063]|nr:unnamed protein product [Peniophora sp. CBMAI 1063]
MAPYFIRNLILRRERQGEQSLMKALSRLTWIQWAPFWSGWLAWFTDPLDFFSVALSVTNLQKLFDKANASDIVRTLDISIASIPISFVQTTAISLTLLLRPAGTVIFGIISDRFGRKWPLVFNLILVAIFELETGFLQTFSQFLALQYRYGRLRDIASGVLQQGYGTGYLVVAVINLFLVPSVSVGWRALFWTSAGLSVFAAGVRALLPESDIFIRAKAAQRVSGTTTGQKTNIFIHETWVMLRSHWAASIYAVLLMTGFTFFSLGSLDLYPTFLQQSKGFSPRNANIATIIANCGAFAG